MATKKIEFYISFSFGCVNVPFLALHGLPLLGDAHRSFTSNNWTAAFSSVVYVFVRG